MMLRRCVRRVRPWRAGATLAALAALACAGAGGGESVEGLSPCRAYGGKTRGPGEVAVLRTASPRYGLRIESLDGRALADWQGVYGAQCDPGRVELAPGTRGVAFTWQRTLWSLVGSRSYARASLSFPAQAGGRYALETSRKALGGWTCRVRDEASGTLVGHNEDCAY
jgi:hypothetical protein